ncbi:MAG: hypothetical protein V2J25_09545 [Desulfatiglans sp.]|jgi:hypothetical protein|nr:hypothetical protein [Desulfatiglans sp.]
MAENPPEGTEDKIAWAEQMFELFGRRLLDQSSIVDLLERLRGAIQASHQAMASSGIIEICRTCDQDEGGSCCGIGLERKYDGWILLINLLLGVKVPRKKLYDKSCLFLGGDGCSLLARHVICVNYLCQKITRHIDPASIKALRDKEGEELNALFFLHEEIKMMVRRWQAQ